MNSDEIGKKAEDYICKLYRKKGYKILSRNYRTRFGELDIIAENASLIAIIEVKARSENSVIPIHESVPVYKQKRIMSASLSFLQESEMMEKVTRLDVALITHKNGKIISCEIIEGAFGG